MVTPLLRKPNHSRTTAFLSSPYTKKHKTFWGSNFLKRSYPSRCSIFFSFPHTKRYERKFVVKLLFIAPRSNSGDLRRSLPNLGGGCGTRTHTHEVLVPKTSASTIPPIPQREVQLICLLMKLQNINSLLLRPHLVLRGLSPQATYLKLIELVVVERVNPCIRPLCLYFIVRRLASSYLPLRTTYLF